MRPEGQDAPAWREYREGVDYTLDADGRWVFTSGHLRERGYCCFQACRNCPWGQAGRSRKDAFQDLQARLDRLESRLHGNGLPVEVTGYHLGTLYARAGGETCATDLPTLTRIVRETAAEVLTCKEVAWE